jgi:hypothetical protein
VPIPGYRFRDAIRQDVTAIEDATSRADSRNQSRDRVRNGVKVDVECAA